MLKELNQVMDYIEQHLTEELTGDFPNENPFSETLQDTIAKTYSEWLPISDYEVIPTPSFSFTKMNEHKKGHAYSEVWLPIKKKG